MTESTTNMSLEGGGSSPSAYDQVRAGIAGILETEVSLDGTPRSQCYDGEVARPHGITKWVGFREGGPTEPLCIVQEEHLPDKPAVYYTSRVIGWTIHGLWGVVLGDEAFGSMYLNRFRNLMMRDPEPEDLRALAVKVPERFYEAQSAGLVEYPLRAVKTTPTSILGSSWQLAPS